jgi:hypothetical protein
MPTQRALRIDELAYWARSRIRDGLIDYKALQSIEDEAQRRWNVERATARSYAENVLAKLQPNERYWRLDAKTVGNMRRILVGNL